jgi:DNA-binding GntR family transcriptional regulator
MTDVTTKRPGEKKAARYAADIIRANIFEGLLAPGQRLIESELMAELDVGRSTIREALLQLDAEGIVELRHQRGSCVRRLTLRDMTELFQMRERLEGLAAYLAAQYAQLPQYKRWLQQARKLWTHGEVLSNEITHMEKNVLLHDGIMRMSNNRSLERVIRPMQISGYRIQYLKLLDENRRRESAREHVQIIDAILAGDAERAELLMRQHIHGAGEMAKRIPGLGEEQPEREMRAPDELAESASGGVRSLSLRERKVADRRR